jgi:hypothetical protein
MSGRILINRFRYLPLGFGILLVSTTSNGADLTDAAATGAELAQLSANNTPQFLIAGTSELGFASLDGTRWTVTSVTSFTDWRSHCRGNGISVRVGRDGQIRTSSNGTNWTVRPAGVPFDLHRVTFGKGRFVAVGNEGALVTSEDGIVWTSRDSGTDERLRGAAFGDGRFVVVGYGGTILTSRDGRRWRARRSGTTARLQDAAYGNGTFVVVGWHGVILTSPTGLVWTPRNAGTTQHLLRVFINDGLSGRTDGQTKEGVGNRDCSLPRAFHRHQAMFAETR